MNPAFVLTLVLFFYPSTEKQPVALAAAFDSAEACLAAGPQAKKEFEAHSEVALAVWGCEEADPGSKVAS